MHLLAASSGEWTLIASLVGVLGLFMYGFLAWFFKRLIDQLDKLTQVTSDMHSQILTMNTRLTFVENKVGVIVKNVSDG